MIDHLALVRMIDDLYAEVVTVPGAWSDARAVEWGTDVLAGEAADRETARHLRRVLRMTMKLAEFWRDPPPGTPRDLDDWRSRVDLAVGARAWRPVLDIALGGLHAAPSVELFDEVKARFRVVNNEFWMEGVGFAEWQSGAAP